MKNRIERVQSEMQKIISDILAKKVADPRIGFVSVTGVEVAPDLKSAKVFISVLGTERERRDTFEGLESATPFIRTELGRKIDLRYVPELIFVHDKSIERGSRVLAIMSKLEREAAQGKKLLKEQKRGGRRPSSKRSRR